MSNMLSCPTNAASNMAAAVLGGRAGMVAASVDGSSPLSFTDWVNKRRGKVDVKVQFLGDFSLSGRMGYPT